MNDELARAFHVAPGTVRANNEFSHDQPGEPNGRRPVRNALNDTDEIELTTTGRTSGRRVPGWCGS